MITSISHFQHKILNASKNPEEYELYKAALEWDIIEPILIKDRGDIQSESKWCNLVKPYQHQITNLITFCRRLPVTLLADDVGLGKTISAGLIISELFSRGKISKLLIVCPKILRDQWKEELQTKFDISSIIVTGKELINACKIKEKKAVITTYNTARIYLEKIEQGDFGILVLDEAHKLRNLHGSNPPEVAKKFYKALSERLFKYVLMLTATPIQNRLWDLYSLVDFLTVARGHQNPFGSPEIFAKKFIADNRNDARHLKSEMHEEFRSIVYGYMSRVRRKDANLQFPERIVQTHLVDPTSEERELITLTIRSITELNILAQIVILQALVSSPEALEKLVDGMAKKGTAPKLLADDIKIIVKKVKVTAKLHGLITLMKKLKSEKPETWRMVIFTRWRETQTTIISFLENQQIPYGIINGDSNSKNQETITKFRKEIPDINIIVSTEAGSEGINLQVANVLVNYDLPWNPMIIEQRVGRIQRLSSEHANVCIFNIILKDTFEQYIVARLMEKLQMASHAIGDIESLLEASGIGEGEDTEEYSSFEKKIRDLVMASEKGQNIEEAIRKAEKSISNAKIELKREEQNINSLLGGMDDFINNEPVSPKLSKTIKTMTYKTFTLNAFKNQNIEVQNLSDDSYIIKSNNNQKKICFDDNQDGILYIPGSSPFENLVDKIVSQGLHDVKDNEPNSYIKVENIAKEWAEGIGANFNKLEVEEISRGFNGKALLRVRATVAHDSYERILEAECASTEHFSSIIGKIGLDPIPSLIEDPKNVGLSIDKLKQVASQDYNILEFCRFYKERREHEIKAAGEDLGKRKKLSDDFTPRLGISLVGLEGNIQRKLKVRVFYNFEDDAIYQSTVNIFPSNGNLIPPQMARCVKTKNMVPIDCLSKCEISKELVLNHLLFKSEISNRLALPNYIIKCSLSGKLVLIDEVENSAVTDELVYRSLLKTSSLSGKKAEPRFFATCEFSNSEVLENEIRISKISGKKYRIDEELISSISRKNGHKGEFVFCSETNQPLLETEAEKCEVTGKIVKPGILEKCQITEKQVMPVELEKSGITGKKALKRYFVLSSISGTLLLESEAIRSVTGKFCAPLEARLCHWSDIACHPEDLKSCDLTGLNIHSKYATITSPVRLESLFTLLTGLNNKNNLTEKWEEISSKVAQNLEKSNCKVKSAELSPTGDCIAVFLESKSWIGFKVRHIGVVYSLKNNTIIGYAAVGKREGRNWIVIKN
jgi:superfamily II DNA or RNA helicase